MMNTSSNSCCGGSRCGSEEAISFRPARINDVALQANGEVIDDRTLRERAHTELLRQHAVDLGLLTHNYTHELPKLSDSDQAVIERMIDQEVSTPAPTDEECQRYYEANKSKFVQGQSRHVRHILFAVTPGVNVHALSVRAETALLELLRKDAPSGKFEQLAAELSNCPSAAHGGDLGWIGPEDCAPELANELFFQTDSRWGMGVHPRLVHTRYGFHIIEVLAVKKGMLPSFEELKLNIQQRLHHQSRATALRQYMSLLAGQAHVEGIELESASNPLLQ